METDRHISYTILQTVHRPESNDWLRLHLLLTSMEISKHHTAGLSREEDEDMPERVEVREVHREPEGAV